MAYSVNWLTKVITIPTSDLVLISGTRYRLSMEAFLIEIRRLESAFNEGLWAPQILEHTNSKPDFAGANYVAFDEVINGYTLQITGVAKRVDVTDTNNNIVDVLIVTGVSVVPSNSAGLVNLNEIRATSFIGKDGKGITIAPTSGTNGTLYPIGSVEEPTKTETNLADLYLRYGYSRIYPVENITLTQDYSEGRVFQAESQRVIIDCDAASDVSNCTFKECALTGTLRTNNIVERSIVYNVTNANQYFDTCAFLGTVTFSADTKIEDSSIATGAAQEVIFDFNNLAIEIIVGDWSAGRIRVKNMVAGSFFGCAGVGGRVVIDELNNGGTVVHGGVIGVDKTFAGNITVLRDSGVAELVWNHLKALAFGKWFGLKQEGVMSKWYEMKAKGAQTGEVLIYDEIGAYGINAKSFATDLKSLGDVKILNVHINSPGGSVIDGNAIYNSLVNHKARVNVHIDGVALSMGSVIAMAGDHISMAENALFMIHNPFGMAFGDAEELRKTADVMDKMKASLIKSYQSQTGMEESAISDLMDAETWLDADEALEMGFVHEVAGAVEMAAHFDLSKYDFKNAPQGEKSFDSSAKSTILTVGGSELSDKDVSDLVGTLNNALAAADKNLFTEDTTMQTEAEKKAAAEKHAAEIKAATDKAVAEALAKEETRKQEIVSAFGSYANDHGELLQECILNKDINADVSRKKLLDAIGSTAKPITSGDTRIEVTADAREKFRAGALEAIQIRNGSLQDDGKNEYRGSTLLDMAKASLRMGGVSMTGMDKMRIVAAAFTHSTSDFPLLLENSLGKELRNAYGNMPETWSGWCDTGSVPDFKSNSRIQLGSFNSLDTIPEGGEYDFGSFSEEAERIQAQTKGKAISLTRQMIINDDLGGFMRIARMMGRAAQRTIGNDVYALLKANSPAMSDGVVPFHANHNNLPAGAAPSATTLGAARTLMRKQMDKDENDYLDIQPAYLISGVEQEDALNILIASETDPSQANSRKPNPIRNIAQLITDPRLNATEWYLVASATEAPLIEVAFLDGNQTPYLESQNGFTVDGVMWKVRMDYGMSFIDFRGGVKGNA